MALYETGVSLYLTARAMPKMNEVIEEIVGKSPSMDEGFPKSVPSELYLDSLESVRLAANEVKSKTGTLHILINKASNGRVSYSNTENGFEGRLSETASLRPIQNGQHLHGLRVDPAVHS